MNSSRITMTLLLTVGGLLGRTASAGIIIDTVAVGNPGNPGDTRYPSVSVPSFGGVGYAFKMGKYEVTAGQYTAFLNAIAATDNYGLYNIAMGDPGDSIAGANIQRSGSPGSYTYSVAADWADRPVNYVSWGDAARFSNWLHNEQPTGAQGLSSTEDGSYFLNGVTSQAALMAVTRKPDATWVIPSEDEWYKAAYHKNDGATGNYWDYPTRSNSVPSNVLGNPTDPGNNATYYNNGYTIGSPYWRTVVGDHENSNSPYGTFDQGGNVFEWNEANIIGSYRRMRGGSFNAYHGSLHASDRNLNYPTIEFYYIGFRVSEIPEPTTMVLLAFSGTGALVRRRRPGGMPAS